MKIGGTPPGGDNFRIPDPDGPKSKKTDGTGKTDFQKQLDGSDGTGAVQGSSPAGAAGGSQTDKLREIVGKVDTNDPKAMEEATDKMVDWVLTERFGEGILNTEGAGDLRKSIREQLLGDPNGSSRIKQIFEKL